MLLQIQRIGGGAIVGIFKAGMAVGIFLAILVVGLVFFVVSRTRGWRVQGATEIAPH